MKCSWVVYYLFDIFSSFYNVADEVNKKQIELSKIATIYFEG